MRIFILSLILFGSVSGWAQFNQWTWMHGDNIPSQPAVYGVMGVPSPSNKPSGRYEACQWTDLNGNFWLYGGGQGGLRNCDLWKYDPTTNMWTWMHGSQLTNQPPVYGTQGVSAPTNTPGANGFGSCTWTDLNGNLWLFGGDDGTNAPYDNLWMYNVITNEWTWMKGSGSPGPLPVHGVQGIAAPANTPGGRAETACTWTDNNGNLWMFGGTTSGIGVSWNDLWKYDPLTNMWTWMKGSNTPNQTGVYGTMNVPANTNTPGGRWCYTSWKDNAGDLWLFGGIDANSPIGMNFFNDLWRYSIATNQWTWMSGSNQPNATGNYGTQCLPASSNVPGARGETRSCWSDSCGNFWLLGGRDLNFSLFNDLWRYNVASGMWTWVSGGNTPNQTGVYGVQTVPAPANKPGGRMGAVSWSNASGLWLFGGYEMAGGEYNDLWLYRPDTISVSITAQPQQGCTPLTVNFSASMQSGCGSIKDFQWDFGDPPSGAANSSGLMSPSHQYNDTGTYTITLIVHDCQNRADTLQTTVTAVPGITLSSTATSSDCFAQGGSVTVVASGGGGNYMYQWQPVVSIGPSITNVPPGTYIVIVTDASGCIASDTITVGLNDSLFSVELGSDSVFCGSVSLILNAGNTGADFLWSTGDTTQSITVNTAGIYSVIISTGLCSDGDTVLLQSVLAPDLPASASFCDQDVITLSAGAQNGVSYLWSTGDTTSSITVTVAGTYSVIVSNGNCVLTDSIVIPEEMGAGPWFPNAFTPDGNSLNEIWQPKGVGITDYHLMIFNRWGELIFETTEFNSGWNGIYKGDLVQEDVYVWVADYQSECTGNREHRYGHVSVIR